MNGRRQNNKAEMGKRKAGGYRMTWYMDIRDMDILCYILVRDNEVNRARRERNVVSTESLCDVAD